MLEARNLNKYFNRRKTNEIHVINNTSLKLPETGLVCLLGPSGSGKTTLLNVLGGLDKADSGEIIFQDHVLKTYRPDRWDYIRSRYFGYVFQNYALLPELTVYENLEFVLKAFNLSKAETEERIDYALSAVGMERFKKRKAAQLSGGQQQRAAIARALVKSPNVVVADEPTGNLDEKNTTQVMNIIKKISLECLVILVTHERRLAEFYGDVIYEISDGRIVQERTFSEERTLQQLDDRNIYLKEFQKEEISSEDLKIRYFYREEKPKLGLNIIFQDGTFYINAGNENLRIKFIDKENEIKVIDSHKPVIKSESIEKFEYHLPPIEKPSRKNIFGFGQTLKAAFGRLGSMRRRQKFIYFVMFLTSIMITLGIINLFVSINVNEREFLYFNRNLIQIEREEITGREGLKEFLADIDADYALPVPNAGLVSCFRFDFFDQLPNFAYADFRATFMPLGILKNPKPVFGRLPERGDEVAVDKYVADAMLRSQQFRERGIFYREQLLDIYIDTERRSYRIVGIIDNNNPNLYLLDADYKCLILGQTDFYPFSTSGINYYYTPEDYLSGEDASKRKDPSVLDLKDDEIVVDGTFFAGHDFRTTYTILDREYKIVGVFPGEEGVLLMSDGEIDYYYEEQISFYTKFSVYSTDKKATLQKIAKFNFRAEDMYQRAYDQHKKFNFSPEIFTFSLIIISASSVFLYFLMRSRLISRVYEIGVYRALGVRKGNIYRIFFSEILIMTTASAVFGIGLVTWFVGQMNKITPAVYYPWYLPLLSFAFMLGVNVIVGLLPVWSLLRLTPSQILSKYDI